MAGFDIGLPVCYCSPMDPKHDDMTSMNVSLPDGLRAFVTERAKGRFGSASEYIRELIREDQRRSAQEKLEALLIEGLESGEPIEVTPEYWASKRKQIAERHRSKSKS
jgi:antitoxin ParD1/3/4